MDKLKGKRIMVWTFMGNARMYEALRDYGDRIDTIGGGSKAFNLNNQLVGQAGDRISGIRHHASLLADFVRAVGIFDADCPFFYPDQVVAAIRSLHLKFIRTGNIGQ